MCAATRNFIPQDPNVPNIPPMYPNPPELEQLGAYYHLARIVRKLQQLLPPGGLREDPRGRGYPGGRY